LSPSESRHTTTPSTLVALPNRPMQAALMSWLATAKGIQKVFFSSLEVVIVVVVVVVVIVEGGGEGVGVGTGASCVSPYVAEVSPCVQPVADFRKHSFRNLL